jgi:hypothetical protein
MFSEVARTLERQQGFGSMAQIQHRGSDGRQQIKMDSRSLQMELVPEELG